MGHISTGEVIAFVFVLVSVSLFNQALLFHVCVNHHRSRKDNHDEPKGNLSHKKRRNASDSRTKNNFDIILGPTEICWVAGVY